MATDRTVLVRLKANVGDFVAGMGTAAAAVKGVTREIDTTNDRTAWLAQSILALGPTLIPLGAAAVPIFAGIAGEAVVAGGAVATLALIFKGMGDGLKALNNYQLQPTADNLDKLHDSMTKLGPAGADFVHFIDQLQPTLASLQNDARSVALPGFEKGIKALLRDLPAARALMLQFADGLGQLAKEAGKGLSGERMADFFRFLQDDAKPILMDLGRTVGNLVDGLGNLFVGFQPLIEEFSTGLLHASQAFASATDDLGTNSGFQSFLVYVEQSGPKALTLLGSLVNVFVAIATAAAPVGDIMLTILPPFLNLIAALAGTPLGPAFLGIAAAMSAYGRVVALASVTTGGLGKAFDKLGVSTKGSLADFRLLPTAINQTRVAEQELAAAEAEAEAARRGYIATLKVNNQLQAEGYTIGALGAQRQADGLTKLELAQNEVTASTGRLKAAQAEQAGIMSAGRLGALKTAGVVGGLTLATSGLAQGTGHSNLAMGAALGSIIPGYGTAIGAAAGFVLDFKDANDQTTASIDQFNQSLRASQGDIQAQQEAIDALSEQSKKTADDLSSDSFGEFFKNAFSTDEVVAFTRASFGMKTADEQLADAAKQAQSDLNLQKEAQANLAAGVPTVTNPLIGLTSQIIALTAAQDAETASTNASVEAMRAKRSEALRVLNAELNYQASIDDANKAIKDNGKNVDDTTKKGRANLQALYALAGAWNEQGNAIKNNDAKLAVAKANFERTAVAMGLGADKAHALANRLFEIPEHRHVAIEMDADPAINKVSTLKSILDSLHSKNLTVALHYQTIGNRPSAPLPGGQPSADGTTVPKTGRGYADRHHYLLADGEEVVSNRYGQADRWRHVLKAINANRMADGGTTGSHPSSGGPKNPGPRQGIFATPELTDLIAQAHSSAEALKILNQALARNNKALDKETAKRDSAAEAIANLSSSVSSGLRTNIFDKPANPFTASQSPTSVLNADTARADEFTSLVKSLSGKGLTGAALAEVASSGDVARLRAFNAMSASDLAAYATAYNNREAALAHAGAVTGQAAFGAEYTAWAQKVDETNSNLRDIKHAIDSANLKTDRHRAKQNGKGNGGSGNNGPGRTGHRRARKT